MAKQPGGAKMLGHVARLFAGKDVASEGRIPTGPSPRGSHLEIGNCVECHTKVRLRIDQMVPG